MSYKSYISYLNDLGLRQVTDYNYLEKETNVALEIERFLNRSIMMFEWNNLPDTIPQEQFELMLQTQGYAIIGQIEGELYACYGGLGGLLDEYYRPTQAIVSIPYLHFNATWDIGTDCIVIRNDTLKQGLLPLFSKYITLQNETEITLLLSLVNQRVQRIISASDDMTIKSAEKYLEDIYKGKQGVIGDNAFLESLNITTEGKGTGNDLRDIVEVLHYLRGQLFNEIGLATNYNLKKERISQAEVELNTDNLYPMIDNMLVNRRQGIEDCYNLFGVDWAVEFNSSWDYRVFNGEPISTGGENNVTDIFSDISDIDSNSDTDNDNDNKGVIELSNIQTEGAIDNSNNSTSDNNDNVNNGDSDNTDVTDTTDTIDTELNELEQTVVEKIEENIIEVAETIAEEIVETLTENTEGADDNGKEEKR